MIPCGKRFMVEAAVRGLSPGGEIIWFRGNVLGFRVYEGGAWTSGVRAAFQQPLQLRGVGMAKWLKISVFLQINYYLCLILLLAG